MCTHTLSLPGGRVMLSRKGVPRVVWERTRTVYKTTSTKTTDGNLQTTTTSTQQVDLIPFLRVSCSLGDFWSFCHRTNQFVVSPKPDVHVHSLNPQEQKFLVVASDGLWNVMPPSGCRGVHFTNMMTTAVTIQRTLVEPSSTRR